MKLEIMIFRAFFILCFSILAIASICLAADDTPESIFQKGNSYYETGKYDKAVTEYSRLLDQGFESGNLYFNLANAYFKKDELGKAVLNFERAKRLMPDDSDLKANYSYVLSRVKKNAPDNESTVTKRAADIFSFFTINSLTIALSMIYILAILVLIALMFFNTIRRPAVIGLIILSVVFIAGIFSLFSRAALLDKEAIVVSEQAEARFEPIENATTHFTLYEGMKVQILQSGPEWVKLMRNDGMAGWVRRNDLEVI